MSNASSKKQSARNARSKKKAPVKRPEMEQVPPPAAAPAEPQQPQSAQYAAATWGSWRGIAIVLGAFFGSLLLIKLLAYFCLLFFTADKINSFATSATGVFVTQVLVYGMMLAIVLLVFRRFFKSTNWRVGVGFTRPWKGADIGYAGLGLLSYFALFIIVSFIIGQFFHFDPTNTQEVGFDNNFLSRPGLVMAFISLVLIPPYVEEMLFRGVVFGGIRKSTKFFWAALWTSILFAIPHSFEGTKSGSILWIAGVDTLVLSFVLCYLREKTGSLWASIILHMTKNCIAFLSLFVFIR